MSDTETNKQLARDYFTAFLAADEAWWAAHIAPGFRRPAPGLEQVGASQKTGGREIRR